MKYQKLLKKFNLVDKEQFVDFSSAYFEGEKVFSKFLGIPRIDQFEINVIPLYGVYIPQTGDRIVGVISSVEVSGWFYFDTMLLVILLASVACLILNEALLKMLHGESLRFKRLVFRCAIIAMYVFLIWIASSFMSIVFSQIELLLQFLFGTLLATTIFVIIILRLRHLFNRLDRG